MGKMIEVADMVKSSGLSAPFLVVSESDNIMSSVTIRGSLDPKETWANGIFQNSRYFLFTITPPKGQRYFDGDSGKVVVELLCGDVGKFRKYTGPANQAVAKLVKFLKQSGE